MVSAMRLQRRDGLRVERSGSPPSPPRGSNRRRRPAPPRANRAWRAAAGRGRGGRRSRSRCRSARPVATGQARRGGPDAGGIQQRRRRAACPAASRICSRRCARRGAAAPRAGSPRPRPRSVGAAAPRLAMRGERPSRTAMSMSAAAWVSDIGVPPWVRGTGWSARSGAPSVPRSRSRGPKRLPRTVAP